MILEANRNRVIVYRNVILPRSETFIKQQIVSLKTWDALLLGHESASASLAISELKVVIIKQHIRNTLHKILWRLFSITGLPRFSFFNSLLEFNAKLIHIHFGVDAVTAWPWLKRLNLPTVITLHGYDITIDPDWWHAGNGGQHMKSYPESLRALASLQNISFIAVSDAIKKKAIELYGIPTEKIKVLHIGINSSAFLPGTKAIAERPSRVLFVGRLVEKKGGEILIRAMSTVKQFVPNSEITIIGDGPLRQHLEKLAKELDVSARFLGVLNSEQVREEMHAARVFCLPSITAANGDAEGFGIVLLEAQACGLPVITSALGGRDEGILNGQTGFSFAEKDENTLSALITRLLTDDALSERMSKAAPQFVSEHFDLIKCTANLEKHYNSLANQ